jgi:hypothetical protein
MDLPLIENDLSRAEILKQSDDIANFRLLVSLVRPLENGTAALPRGPLPLSIDTCLLQLY